MKFPRDRELIERSLQPILSRATAETPLLENGHLLNWMTSEIRAELDVDFVFVGQLSGADWDSVTTLSVATEQGLAENFSYSLADTPCGDVINRDSCIFPGHVASMFPKDELLVEMGIESYVGIPLQDDVGRPIGLIVCLGKQPLATETTHTCLDLFSVFRKKLAEILQINRNRRDLQMVGSLCNTDPDENWITQITRNLARVYSTKGALLAAAKDLELSTARTATPTTHANTLPPHDGNRDQDTYDLVIESAFIDGISIDPGTIELPESLVAKLQSGPTNQFLAHGLITRTANANQAADALQDALYIPIYSDEGRLLGLAAALHDQPLNDAILDHPVTIAFIQRLSFELRSRLLEVERAATQRRVLELERTESLGLLAGGIAHDFNNLLVGVLGNAELTLMDTPRSDRAKHECLSDIRDAAISGSQLAKQLLTYAGRSSSNPKPFELRDEVQEISRIALTSTARRAILDTQLSPDPLRVEGDPVQVRQIVMNLVTNAADAIDSEKDGFIRIKTGSSLDMATENIQCQIGRLDANQQYAWVEISDNGSGMDRETARRIFEPFYSTKTNGHGLGLASVHGIVRSHGGAVEVDSALGKGTRITVYLPLHGTTVDTDTVGTAPQKDLPASQRVLVIDDEDTVRRLITRFLDQLGHTVISAEDGRTGLKLFAEQFETIDIVLLDLAMPHMSGTEVLAALRQIDPHVKVIISSGNMNEELDVPRLDKPYTYDDFQHALAALL